MNTTTFRIATICAGLAMASQLRAAQPALPQDGWVSWQVEAVEGAPAWCCWDESHNDVMNTAACKLDAERQGFGSRDHATTDSVRIYAKTAGGQIERLRTLAAACAVETKTPVRKLENVTTDDSARWLIGVSKTPAMLATRRDMTDDVLAALAIHRGEIALTALSTTARTDAGAEARKKAIFWLAELRGEPGANVVADAMFNDRDMDVRRHSAFAITLSKSPKVTELLTRQGNTDAEDDVRSQAWFWLAHTGAPNAETPIHAALKTDKSDHVREQAVFALSQLPDDRAIEALIAVAEDKSLSNEQRKRALFWLGQSDSPQASAYIDKVLMGRLER